MALMGALVAACTALIGSSRSAAIGTKVQQSNAAGEYQSASTKYRVILSNLQQLHALLPEDPGFEENAKNVAEAAEKSVVDRSMGQLVQAQTGRILNQVSPSRSDALRMVSLARTYKQERDVTRAWQRSYDAEIGAHDHASHHFEYAFLSVEFALVLCSVALLLTSRNMWRAAVVVAVLGTGYTGKCALGYRSELRAAERQIATSEAAFKALDRSTRSSEDDTLLQDIERAYGVTPR